MMLPLLIALLILITANSIRLNSSPLPAQSHFNQSNMSKTIAVIGTNGVLGKPTLEALLSAPFNTKVKFPIKVFSSSNRTPVESDKIEVISNTDGYKGLFEGVDAVINLAGPPHSRSPQILEELVASKVKLYIPSQFGIDLAAADETFPGFLASKGDYSKGCRAAGIKVADVYTGFFMRDDQTFVGRPFSWLNFDAEKKEVEIVGDESTLINPSFERDIGLTVASLVTKDDYSTIPDFIRMYSGRITLGDLVEHYEKLHGVKLTKKYTSPEKLVEEAKVKYQNFSYSDLTFYFKTFLALGDGKGAIFESDNEREFINPGESLFKWAKYTI